MVNDTLTNMPDSGCILTGETKADLILMAASGIGTVPDRQPVGWLTQKGSEDGMSTTRPEVEAALLRNEALAVGDARGYAGSIWEDRAVREAAECQAFWDANPRWFLAL